MERWSISEFSTIRWSLQQEIEKYSQLGFGQIGLWHQKLDDYEIESTEDWLFESQIGVSSLSWLGGFTGCDGISHQDAIKISKEKIRLAARLGANTVIFHPGARNGHTQRHAERLLYSALDELVPCAIDFGIKLVLEPMDQPFQSNWSIFPRWENTIKLIQNYPENCLGIVLDLFHVGFNAAIFEKLDELVERLFLVQVADRSFGQIGIANEENRRIVGQGDIPLLEWIQKFESVGYQGNYEIEYHGPEFEFADYESVLVETRNWIEQPEVAELFGGYAKELGDRRS